MKASKRTKPRVPAVTRTKGKMKGMDKGININRDTVIGNPFAELIEGLQSVIGESKDGRQWQSETIFMTVHTGNDMSPTIRSGVILWVDTAERPVWNRKFVHGIIEGEIYLLHDPSISKLNKKPYHNIREVYISSGKGGTGRLYVCERWRGKHDVEVPFNSPKDVIEDNKRYVGRVIGWLNPALSCGH